MKKTLLFFALILLASFAFADNDELGYRAASVSNSALYPEGNYNLYPSRLSTLNEDLLQLNPIIQLNNLGTTVQTWPTGHANEGGTLKSNNADYRFGINGMYFTPLSSQFSLGVMLTSDIDLGTLTNTKDSGYNVPVGEVEIQKRFDNDYTITPTFLFSLDLSDFILGGRIQSYNYFDPAKERFLATSDTQINAGETYYVDGDTEIGEFSNGVNANFSLGSGPGDLEWAVSLGGSFYYTRSVEYTAFDSDADTYGDTIMTTNDWQVYTGPGGNAAAYYDEIDHDISYDLSVDGFVSMEMENSSLLIVTLNWTPLLIDKNRTYTHTAVNDLREDTDIANSSLLNFTVGAALEMPLGKRSTIRFGTGIDLERTANSRIWLDAAGVMNFDPLNVNHYPEDNYATDPQNGAVITSAGTPATAFSMYFPLRVEFRFNPAETVTLFSSLSGFIEYSSNTYHVFNTFDDTIWTEKTSNFEFDVSSITLFTGVEFRFNSKAMMIIGTDISPFSSGVNLTGDPLPESDGVVTTNTTNSLFKDSDIDFRFNIFTVLRY